MHTNPLLPVTQPLTDWLRNGRGISTLCMEMLAHWFDLEGALEAQQAELAWWTQERLLFIGIRLHIADVTGTDSAKGTDRAEADYGALDALLMLNEELGKEAWCLCSRNVPADLAELKSETQLTVDFLRHKLHVPVGSRTDAIRQWADSAKVLREMARMLGIAGSDEWYLRDEQADDVGDWYQEVMRSLS